MKPHILGIAFCVFCSLASNLAARPGETIAQCDKRYGKPLHIEKDLRIYAKAGIDLGVFVRNGVCWQIVYSHLNGNPLTSAEKQAILEAYGKWTWMNQDSTGKTWESPDKKLIATENTANNSFMVVLKGEMKRAESEKGDAIRQSF